MPEDVARFTVLLEDIQTQVRAIADGYVGLSERMDRMDARLDRLETRFDGLEIKVDALAMKVDKLEAKVDKLETRFEGFAGETTRRLERIETHLGLNGPLPLRRAARPATRRRPKKTAKSS